MIRPVKWMCGLGVAAVLMVSTTAQAVTFNGTNSEGRAVSGQVNFSINAAADELTITMTNTTTNMFNAGQLFTGLDFSLDGLTSASLISKTAVLRTVAGNGTYSDTATPKDLSWKLVNLGSGNFQLNFNPNAKDAIIAAPAGGNYSGTNGSIKGNPGHNPYAAVTATFVLSVNGLEADTDVHALVYRFGTNLSAAQGKESIPEPMTAGLSLLGLGALSYVTRRRRAN